MKNWTFGLKARRTQQADAGRKFLIAAQGEGPGLNPEEVAELEGEFYAEDLFPPEADPDEVEEQPSEGD